MTLIMSTKLYLNSTKREIRKLRDKGQRRRLINLKKSTSRYRKKEKKNSLIGQESFRNNLMKFTKIKTEGENKSIRLLTTRKKKSQWKKKMKQTSNP